MLFTVTIRAAEDNICFDVEVEASDANEAMDLVFDRVSCDIKEAWCDEEYYC